MNENRIAKFAIGTKLSDIRLMFRDLNRDQLPLPEKIELHILDWYSIINEIKGSEPIDVINLKIAGVPVEIVECK